MKYLPLAALLLFSTAGAEVPVFSGSGNCDAGSQCPGAYEQGQAAIPVAMLFWCKTGVCQLWDGKLLLVHMYLNNNPGGHDAVDILIDVHKNPNGTWSLQPRIEGSEGWPSCEHTAQGHLCQANPGTPICDEEDFL